MLRFLTAGESHGPGLTTIVEGLPKGLAVSREALAAELARRRAGYGRGKRMSLEADEVEILGGVRHGRTLGSPVSVLIRNTEWPKWSEIMSPGPGKPGKEVTRPRPGHADLAGMIKYGAADARDILERASARETAARTVAGVLAKQLLGEVGASVMSHVVGIGHVVHGGPAPGADEVDAVESSEVRCADAAASAAMMRAIDAAAEARDTLGGVFEVLAFGVPIGVGSHVQHDRRLDAALAAALMSIPAVKGVEIGDGFETARLRGSESHDEIVRVSGAVGRETNRAGGIEGGISNGEMIRVRAAMKPISTLMQPLRTVDMATGDPAQAVRERSDVCAVPAAAVVGEQMAALIIAREIQRKFGGDTVAELKRSVEAYSADVEERITG